MHVEYKTGEWCENGNEKVTLQSDGGVAKCCIFSCISGGCTQTKSVAQQEPARAELEVWTFFDKNVPGAYYVFLWDTLAEKYGYDINVKSYSTEQLKDKLKVALICNELPDIFLVWVALTRDICLMQEPVCRWMIISVRHHLRKNIFSPIRMACIILFRVCPMDTRCFMVIRV